MEIEPFWRKPSFRDGVAASLVAAAIWYVGGRFAAPLWAFLAVSFWPGIGEWIHEAGWLAFWITIAIWVVNRRGQHAATLSVPPISDSIPVPTPSVEVTTTGYPMRVDPSSSTTFIAWRNKHATDEGGRVDLVKGSIHVELWNTSGKGRTNKTRLLRFT